jgi:hypothetical protein
LKIIENRKILVEIIKRISHLRRILLLAICFRIILVENCKLLVENCKLLVENCKLLVENCKTLVEIIKISHLRRILSLVICFRIIENY